MVVSVVEVDVVDVVVIRVVVAVEAQEHTELYLEEAKPLRKPQTLTGNYTIELHALEIVEALPRASLRRLSQSNHEMNLYTNTLRSFRAIRICLNPSKHPLTLHMFFATVNSLRFLGKRSAASSASICSCAYRR